MLDSQKCTSNPKTNNVQEMDSFNSTFNGNIHSEIEDSTYFLKSKKGRKSLPPEILIEIASKNRIHREWQKNLRPLYQKVSQRKDKICKKHPANQ